MNPAQRAIHAARTADNSAKTRAKKKLMQGRDWEQLTEEEKKLAIKNVQDEVLANRWVLPIVIIIVLILKSESRGYSRKTIEDELQKMLSDLEEKHKHDVLRQDATGDRHPLAKLYWFRDDEIDEKEANDPKHDYGETYCEENGDITAGILAGLAGDQLVVGPKKRNLTIKETKDALAIAQARKG